MYNKKMCFIVDGVLLLLSNMMMMFKLEIVDKRRRKNIFGDIFSVFVENNLELWI